MSQPDAYAVELMAALAGVEAADADIKREWASIRPHIQRSQQGLPLDRAQFVCAVERLNNAAARRDAARKRAMEVYGR